ncbi:MAG: tetratricopeptide repeat protein [Myxococcales bacterium]|nr:tetratricopeptide repeat protein [Myxococcales bacterium]MCB9530496.1 tetratricopeptide repeat protein [Myxococcales bacterium]MCB9533448.1 tetratricopeptide repeat protein [Myxococcales bacterium]
MRQPLNPARVLVIASPECPRLQGWTSRKTVAELRGARRAEETAAAAAVRAASASVRRPADRGAGAPAHLGVRLGLVRSVALSVSLVVAGCGVPAASWDFNRALLAADALADDGDFSGAYSRYLELASESPRDDLRSYIRYRLGYMLEQQGRDDEALAAYASVYQNPTSLYDHSAGQALFHAGRIVARRDGAAAAEPLWKAVIETFPNTYSADDALYELIDTLRASGRSRELYAYLVDRFIALQRTEIADNLAYWTARVLQEDLADPESALEVYGVLVTNFHPSGLVDDSVWRSALCYRTLGRVDDEYRLLKAFIDTREVSWIMADYESEYYMPTLFRMAEIHESRGELREAIAVLERFQGMYKLSLRRDDTQYHIMELQLELGDLAGMRESLAWLEAEYPRSRFVRAGRELLTSAEQRGAP